MQQQAASPARRLDGVPPHVWTYWENLEARPRPPYLDLCSATVAAHCGPELELHRLDEHSALEWLPDVAPSTWARLGTPVRRSDYARVRLIDRYGGLWLDDDCIVMRPLRELLGHLVEHEVVGWGGDLEGGMFFNNLLAARPGGALVREWIEAQDALLSSSKDWDGLSWAALGQDLSYPLRRSHALYDLPACRVAPVMWYEWRRLLSPFQSPLAVMGPEPFTVMLWNSAMSAPLLQVGAEELLGSRRLLGRLFRIALGMTEPDEELDAWTRLDALSRLRFSRAARGIAARLASLAALAGHS